MPRIALVLACILAGAAVFAADPAMSAEDKAREIVATLIKPGMTEFEKTLLLHEYITGTVTYGKWNGQTTAWTALVHRQADCVGFAKSLALLFRTAGLDAFHVDRRRGHLWTRVMIRGTYYNIDATWSAVKSRWPRYAWFLRSDAQNDAEHHRLDSGERYADCPKQFTLSNDDYPHRDWLRDPAFVRVLGTIELGPGEVAPKGGLEVRVNYQNVRIPEGKTSAFFITTVGRKKGAGQLELRLVTPGTAYPEFSYVGADGGWVSRATDARDFGGEDLDVAGFTIRFGKATCGFAGTLRFDGPTGGPAAAGKVLLRMLGDRPDGKRVEYRAWIQVPVGARAVPFRIPVAARDMDTAFDTVECLEKELWTGWRVLASSITPGAVVRLPGVWLEGIEFRLGPR